MTIKNFLFLLSLGLLIWLFIDSLFQLDIAATKNNALTIMNKMEVDRLQNIDSVKTVAKTNFEIIRTNTRTNSQLATKGLWIIAALGLLQMGICLRTEKQMNNETKMATQIFPNCKLDSFTFCIDEEESPLTKWNCYECGLVAFEDESLDRECSKLPQKNRKKVGGQLKKGIGGAVIAIEQ